MSEVKPLPMSKKIIYALGQFGWSLAAFGVLNLLNYFYVSPTGNDGHLIFPIVIGSSAILGVIAAVSRLFDAVTDPLIAAWSDRSHSSLGRRMKFLAIGVIPFVLLSFFVFFPPVMKVSWINVLWLFLTIIPYLFFYNNVCYSFFALISEFGHSPKDFHHDLGNLGSGVYDWESGICFAGNL